MEMSRPLLLTLLLSGLAWGKGPWHVVGLDSIPKNYCARTDDSVLDCSPNKSDMEDLAAALNEAHERRVHPWGMVNCPNGYLLEGYGVTKKSCEDSK
jgi:hypothetical protein